MRKKKSMGQVMVIPYPAQGHINSLLHLSHKLVSQGINVLFLNTDYTHKRIAEAAANGGGGGGCGRPVDDDHHEGGELNFASLPDGLNPEDDRNEFGRLAEAMLAAFPSKLRGLIQSFQGSSTQVITCIIADVCMAWTLEVSQKLGIRGALHWPMAASYLALQSSWPHLEDAGIIDSNGFPIKHEKIQLYSGMPAINANELPWYICGSTFEERRIIFKISTKNMECLKLSDWWLCNSAFELEPESFALLPKLRPIGPLIATSNIGGQFWSQDMSCLSWLDEQKPKSTVFISFGSITVFNLEQFQELASAIDALRRPVLWVVRSDLTANGSKINEVIIKDRFRGKNVKIVNWAPQLKVLSHHAIACFVSHCGWNSTMEGVANGVPFLCWPYFADQALNKRYICELWKIGLSLEKNANGIVTKDEVTTKVGQLLDDKAIQERAERFKEVISKSISEDGNSLTNFDHFIKWLETPDNFVQV